MRAGGILPIEVMARREDWSEGVSIYMRQQTVGNGSMMAQPVSFSKHEKGSFVEPMLRIGIQQGQQLMDELWKCGLRPTEGAGSAGAMAATQRHLDDMRKLVFQETKP